MTKYFIKNKDEFKEITLDQISEDIGKEKILYLASEIHKNKLITDGESLTSSKKASDLVNCLLKHNEEEQFIMLVLNSQNKLIDSVVVSIGTIDQASVYVRECVKHMLRLNGKSAILAHSHPSGDPTPSQSDRRITTKLQSAFGLLDMQILDHLIVGDTIVSFAEKGYI